MEMENSVQHFPLDFILTESEKWRKFINYVWEDNLKRFSFQFRFQLMPRIILNHHEFNSFAKLSAGGVTTGRCSIPGQHESCKERGAFTCLVPSLGLNIWRTSSYFINFANNLFSLKNMKRRNNQKQKKNNIFLCKYVLWGWCWYKTKNRICMYVYAVMFFID